MNNPPSAHRRRSFSPSFRYLAPRCLAMLVLAGTPSAWGINVAEPPDFPNTTSGPAVTLNSGTNTFSGTVHTPADGQDRFDVTVPAGFRIVSATKTFFFLPNTDFVRVRREE